MGVTALSPLGRLSPLEETSSGRLLRLRFAVRMCRKSGTSVGGSVPCCALAAATIAAAPFSGQAHRLPSGATLLLLGYQLDVSCSENDRTSQMRVSTVRCAISARCRTRETAVGAWPCSVCSEEARMERRQTGCCLYCFDCRPPPSVAARLRQSDRRSRRDAEAL